MKNHGDHCNDAFPTCDSMEHSPIFEESPACIGLTLLRIIHQPPMKLFPKEPRHDRGPSLRNTPLLPPSL